MPLINQDAHIAHHLYPTLPFYSYYKVWKKHANEFYPAGVENSSVFQEIKEDKGKKMAKEKQKEKENLCVSISLFYLIHIRS